MDKSLVLLSPAKINLFFHVLEKRKDGFHDIASIMQTIDLCDIVSIGISKKDYYRCNDFSLKWNDKNIVYKAVQLFKRKTNLSFFTSIELFKRIPKEAGLGGGSSNAATVLWGLNELFNRPFNNCDLKILGSELGSDVSFFFSLGCGFCQSRGEVVYDIDKSFFNGYIACPNIGVSTKEAFEKFEMQKKKDINLQRVINSYKNDAPIFFNDLEDVAFSLQPQLFKIKSKLFEKGYNSVTMTGSGSAFFFKGSIKPVSNKIVSFYSVSRIRREMDSWYQIKNKKLMKKK